MARLYESLQGLDIAVMIQNLHFVSAGGAYWVSQMQINKFLCLCPGFYLELV